MAGINKEEQARREGMAYALRIARKKGIEGLEEELKFRNITQMPIGVPRKAVDECVMNIKHNTIDTFTILMAAALRDSENFGKQRVMRVISEFTQKAESIQMGYCSWDDWELQLAEELGINLSIRKNDKDVKI